MPRIRDSVDLSVDVSDRHVGVDAPDGGGPPSSPANPAVGAPAKKLPPPKPPRTYPRNLDGSPAMLVGAGAPPPSAAAPSPVAADASPSVTAPPATPSIPGGQWTMGQAVGSGGGTPRIWYRRLLGRFGGSSSPSFVPLYKVQAKDRANYRAMKNAARGDPNFRFNDSKRTVETKFTYQEMTEQNPAFKQAFNDALYHKKPDSTNAAQDAPGVFGTEQYQQQLKEHKEALNSNADARLQDFRYDSYDAKLSPAEQDAMAKRLDESSGADSARYLLTEKNYQGISLGEGHGNTDSKKYLIENMQTLKQSGVNTLYIEHFRYHDHQRMIDDYMASSDPRVTGQLGTYVDKMDSSKNQANDPYNLRAVLENAKANGLRVVGIDDAFAKGPPAEKRVKLMNTFAESVIRSDQGRGDGKYVILVGAAHNQTHEGKQAGVPGLGQVLEIPTVEPSGGDKIELQREDTSLRLGTDAH